MIRILFFYFLRVRLRHHLQFDRCNGGGTYSMYIIVYLYVCVMYIYYNIYISSRCGVCSCVCICELCTYEYNIIYYNTVDELTISSSLHRLSSSSDIRFSCFLKYLRLAACRLNHVYENALTLGSNASMNGWNSSCG